MSAIHPKADTRRPASVPRLGHVLASMTNSIHPHALTDVSEIARPADLCYNARMNMQLKVTKIGNSAGVILPKELLARLRVGPGDTVFVSESPDGIRLTASNPDFATKMAVAEAIMREDRDILRVLAK